MRFEAKKDTQYTVIFWVVILALLGTFIYALLFDDTTSSKIIGCVLTSSIILISALFWFNTYYMLVDDNLIIKYGFLTKTISIDSITSIHRTDNNLLAGPAYSLNKIEITYNNGSGQIFIAPQDELSFIDQLIAQSKNRIQQA